MNSFLEWWKTNVNLEVVFIEPMENLIKFLCFTLLVVSLAIFVSVASENRLTVQVQKLEKALIQSKETPQKLEIKYIK